MRMTHEIRITKDHAPEDNVKSTEQGDPLGDMFDKRGLSNAIGRKDDREMRGHNAEEQTVVLPPDGLNPVKVILFNRRIIHDGKGHCNAFNGERPYV